ncbi:MAG: N-acetyl-gamma-glutamyl-phosphate reductase [candidate division Zixibacteria bacterium]|nr:N-acetyl-gamma-glutamyl-phosphate reductase [candidate division Zixibacteria bacterium]
MITVSIVGASGYGGGELLRLLLFHPHVKIQQVTSESLAGKLVGRAHPNLRKITGLKFSSMADLKPCDVLCLCLPHGAAMERCGELLGLGERILDLSADFRLRNPADYPIWYGHDHPHPEWLGRFVYGLAELNREEIRTARHIACTGCLAAASILSLAPLLRAGAVDPSRIFIEGKIGSSAGGNKADQSSHHPERSGAVRSFKPTGHRHTAEMLQELDFGTRPEIHFSGTAIELVRGILITAHTFVTGGQTEKDIWGIYRKAYDKEPFIRIIKEQQGIYRYPEPKTLAGTNYCDIGFERDPHTDRLVVMGALDNLVKGAAGQAVQNLNIMFGWDERTGLEFPGLHP